MSTLLDVQVPARVATPRVALFLERLIDACQSLARLYRARRDLHERARDAYRVRELARRLERSDPGVASDLRCAADRYY